MNDIYYNIVLHLPIKDIIKCRLVNGTFYNIIKSEFLWKNIYVLNFNNTNIFKINFYETCKLHILLQVLCTKIKHKNSYIELHNLQTLDLYNNQLTHIPTELGQLNNLQTLYLDNNQLTHIPTKILI